MFELPYFYFLSTLLLMVYAGDLYSKFNQHDYNIEFTRLELVDYNKKFYETYKVVTFKYNRSVAVANITFKTKVFVDNKHTQILGQVYKFYSNEYRVFPIRLQLNYCNAVKSNLMGLRNGYLACGNMSTCSLQKGLIYQICNWKPDPKKFPPMIPSGQYKVEITLLVNGSLNVMFNSYGRVYRSMD